jgi:hypothetical protein
MFVNPLFAWRLPIDLIFPIHSKNKHADGRILRLFKVYAGKFTTETMLYITLY